MTRFELATPRPPDEYATRLRHIPIHLHFNLVERYLIDFGEALAKVYKEGNSAKLI